MNNSNCGSASSSSRERASLTSNDDFLETATQYLNMTDGFFRHAPGSVHSDQEQSSSTSSYPPAAVFHSPAHHQYRQPYMVNQRSNDGSSTSAASWNSVNANSQMSTWTPSFISHYMVPWQQEEKKSSWDDDSDDGDASDQFKDEPQDNMDLVSDESVVSKASTKKSARKSFGLCDLLCMEIEVPLQVAYSIAMLLIGLTIMCFVVGYQSEQQAKQRNSVPTPPLSPKVLTPVAAPTSTLAPTALAAVTAMPSPAPTVTATPQPRNAAKASFLWTSCVMSLATTES